VIIGTREEDRGEEYITRSFDYCTHHQTLFEGLNKKYNLGEHVVILV
jgi:hypothetical protein